MSEFIDVMRAKELEPAELDLDIDVWRKGAVVLVTFYDAAIWAHRQHVARRAQNR
jgi:hypothetical protein